MKTQAVAVIVPGDVASAILVRRTLKPVQAMTIDMIGDRILNMQNGR